MSSGIVRSKPKAISLEPRLVFDAAMVDTLLDYTTDASPAIPDVDPIQVTANEAVQAAQHTLANWLANDGDNDALRAIYGEQHNDAALDQLREQLLNGENTISVELDNDSLSADTAAIFVDTGDSQRIIFNTDWLVSASTAAAQAVAIEELGHSIDALLNPEKDTAGDEGHLLAATILAPANPQTQTTENDQIQIELDGVSYTAERAGTYPIAQITYVPIDETAIASALTNINGTSTTSIQTTLGIAAVYDGTIIVYDHWEDGYEIDISNPLQASTEIWGDGDLSNGGIPGASSDAEDVISAGIAIEASNPVNLLGPTVDYDARDKIASTAPISVTRSAYSTDIGANLSGAVNLFDSRSSGTSFVLPFGTNTTITDSLTFSPFSYTSVHIIAFSDNTSVSIDTDNDGVTDYNLTLDEGQTFSLDSGWLEGATIDANNDIGVYAINGTSGTQAARWYQVFSQKQLSNDYYTPVMTPTTGAGGTESSASVFTLLYNPNNTDIIIDVEGISGTSQVTVTANSSNVVKHGDEALHFSSVDGSDFAAFGLVDQFSGEDWSYTLVPSDVLSNKLLSGWAPGNNGASSVNENPLWITPTQDTWLYVNAPLANLRVLANEGGATTILSGESVDAGTSRFAVQELGTYRIFDDSDKDQSSLSIYTIDGTALAGAWGPGTNNATLDAGTTLVSVSDLKVERSYSEIGDGDGLLELGETIQYTLTITNERLDTLYGINTSAVAVDTNIATYVINSATLTVTDGNGAVTLTNNDLDGTNNTLPSLGAGFTVIDTNSSTNGNQGLESGGTITFTYQLTINDVVSQAMLDSAYNIATTTTVSDDGSNVYTGTVSKSLNSTETITTPVGTAIVIVDQNSSNTGQLDATENTTQSGQVSLFPIGGISALSINGTSLSIAQLDTLSVSQTQTITGSNAYGNLVLTGFDSATGTLTYYYDANIINNPTSTTVDTFNFQVTAIDSSTATASLGIRVTDSYFRANSESATVREDVTLSASGNLLDNDSLGADSPTTVTSIYSYHRGVYGTVGQVLAGVYGTITVNSDGTFDYQLNNDASNVQALTSSQTVYDYFRYAATDADGSSSTTYLFINVQGTSTPPTITLNDSNGTDSGVLTATEEQNSDPQTLNFSAEQGFNTLTVNGNVITEAQLSNVAITPATAATPLGNLTITSADLSAGIIGFTYTPSVQNHSSGEVTDSFTIAIKDDVNNSTSTTLTALIADSAPSGVADTANVREDSSLFASGNVLNGAGADYTGADTPLTVTAFAAGDTGTQPTDTSTVGTTISGSYGDLTINANGDYSYSLNNSNTDVQALLDGETIYDIFTYALVDADGSPSFTTLTINVAGTSSLPTLTIDDLNGGEAGDFSAIEAQAVPDLNFNLTTELGLQSLTIAGTVLTEAQLLEAQTLIAVGIGGINLATTYGQVQITNYDATTGDLNYRYTPSAADHSGGSVSDIIEVEVRDNNNNVVNDSIKVTVIDTAPLANNDAIDLIEDEIIGVSGNLISDAVGADSIGADAPTLVVGVESGLQNARLIDGTTVGTAISGSYGTLSVAADGSYTYDLDNASASVQSLRDGQSAVEYFTYTLQDADGSTSFTSLKVTVNGRTALPTITINDINGALNGNFSVSEDNGMVAGSIYFTAEETLKNLEIGDTNYGEIKITNFDVINGRVDFEYTITPQDHTLGEIIETINITVTDSLDNQAVESLAINITDSLPTTVVDAVNGNENDNTIIGNVLGNDTIGADLPGELVGMQIGADKGDLNDVTSFENPLAGNYGTLAINDNGDYTYFISNSSEVVQALATDQVLTDTFTYTVTDGDGSLSSANLVLTINGVSDEPTIKVTQNDGSSISGLSVLEGQTINGLTIDFAAEQGLSDIEIAGTTISLAELQNLASTPVEINTANGIIAIAGFTANTAVQPGSLSLNYTANIFDHSLGPVNDSFDIIINDQLAANASQTVAIEILDSAPITANDTNALSENSADVTGNVLQDGFDILGADLPASVVGVQAGAGAANLQDPATINSTINGSYGSLALGSDGAYTYTADQSLAAVQALASGETLTDSFTYTVADNDGSISSATLDISIDGVSDAPVVGPVDASGDPLTTATVEEEHSLNDLGINFLAEQDLAAISLAGTRITLAQLENLGTTPINIASGAGTMTLTEFVNGDAVTPGYITFNYTANQQDHSSGDPVDTITINVEDALGASTDSSIAITITDSTFSAVSDSNALDENSADVTGNVLQDGFDILGADLPASVVGVQAGAGAADLQDPATINSVINGSYGSLTLGSDGAYTYTADQSLAAVQALASGETLTDSFTYTVADNDGSISSATLDITLDGVSDLPNIRILDADQIEQSAFSISEGSTLNTLSLNFNAEQGLASLDIAGTTITLAQLNDLASTPIVISSGAGSITLVDFTESTATTPGSLSFDYTAAISDNASAPLIDIVDVSVTDSLGATSQNTLNITITDSTFSAVADSNTLNENTANTSGNVLTDGMDTTGLDNPTAVVGVQAGANQADLSDNSGVGSALDGNYGQLTLNADGSYQYDTNRDLAIVQALEDGQSLADTFTYTIADSDGSIDSTNLTIRIEGSSDAPVIGISNAAGDDAGIVTVVEKQTIADLNLSLGAEQGLSQVDIAGTTLTLADLIDININPVTLNSDEGTLTLTKFVEGGAITASHLIFDYQAPVKDNDAADVVDFIAITVTDSLGASTTDNLQINITDSALVAVDDIDTINENALAPVSGNIYEIGVDTLSADSPIGVVGIQFGDNKPNLDDPTSLELPKLGDYGSLSIASNGDYQYTVNNNLAAVQALAEGETLTDHFTYTIADSDGSLSSATLRIVVEGSSDAPSLSLLLNAEPVTQRIELTEASTLQALSLSFSAEQSLAAIDIAGTRFDLTQLSTASNTQPLVIDTGVGTLSVTNYTAASPVSNGSLTISYSTGTHDHSLGEVTDNIDITVEDQLGNQANGQLEFRILDSEPTAIADTNSLDENTADTTGNVLNDGIDVASSDGALNVVGVGLGDTQVASNDPASIGTLIEGNYGTLTLQANGDYQYTPYTNNTIQALADGDAFNDVFTYTIADNDGSLSTATLSIAITGISDTPIIALQTSDALTLDQQTLQEGSSLADLSAHFTAEQGLASLSVAGTELSLSDLNALNTAPIIIETSLGSLELVAFDDASSPVILHFNYTAAIGQQVDGVAEETVTFTVTDALGQQSQAGVTLQVTDTPLTTDNVILSATEDGDSVADSLAASMEALSVDGAVSVVGVTSGNTTDPLIDAGTVGTTISGEYGELSIDASGALSYTINQSLSAVQALNSGESLSDIFTVTLQDADGSTVTQVLEFSVLGSDGVTQIEAIDSAAGNYTLQEASTLNSGLLQLTHEGDITALNLTGPTISGTTIPLSDLDSNPISIATQYGELQFTHYDTDSGELSFSFTANTLTHDSNALQETVTLTLVDASGAEASTDLNFTITDSEPAWLDATLATTIEQGVTQSLALDVLNSDLVSAIDQPLAVVSIAVGSGGDSVIDPDSLETALRGSWGDIVVSANGSLFYSLDNSLDMVQQLTAGENLTDSFTLTITDSDGSLSSHDINITIAGVAEPALLQVTDSLPSSSADYQLTEAGSIDNASLTVKGFELLSINDTVIDLANVSTTAINTALGTLQISSYDTTSGLLRFSYRANAQTDSNDTHVDSITLLASNADGTSSEQTLQIELIDSTPSVSGTRLDIDISAGFSASTQLIIEAADQPAAIVSVSQIASYTIDSTSVNTPVSGHYGELIVSGDGALSYTATDSGLLNNTTTLRDSFYVTVADADGSLAIGLIQVFIKPVADSPSIELRDSNGDTAGNISLYELTKQTFAAAEIDAPAGLASLQIAGTTITAEQLTDANYPIAIPYQNGDLWINNLIDGSLQLTYTPANAAPDTETLNTISLQITDVLGRSSSADLNLNILDRQPRAVDDRLALNSSETDQLIGNVMKNDIAGEGGIQITGVSTGTVNSLPDTLPDQLAGQYGTLILAADGDFTYQLDPDNTSVADLQAGTVLKDSFNYTLTDRDGSSDLGQLQIIITSESVAPIISSNDLLLDEGDDALFQSISVIAKNGLASLQVGDLLFSATQLTQLSGQNQQIEFDNGTITLLNYDANVGKLSFHVTTEIGSQAGATSQFQLPIIAIDAEGLRSEDIMQINVVDSSPIARSDLVSINRDLTSSATGNLVTGINASSDSLSNDTPTLLVHLSSTVDSANVSADGVIISGAYGTLSVDNAGNYNYQLDAANPTVKLLENPSTLSDDFIYQLQDADGSVDQARLRVVISADADNQFAVFDLPEGSSADTFTLSLFEGQVSDLLETQVQLASDWVELQVGDITLDLTDTALQDNLPITMATELGQLAITAIDATNGSLFYQFSAEVQDHSAGNPLSEALTFSFTDSTGNSLERYIDVLVFDTTPRAHSDQVTLTLGETSVTGNILSGENSSADETSLDSPNIIASPNLDTVIQGEYGELTLTSDGEFTYQLTSQISANGGLLVDRFDYSLLDSDGSSSAASLRILINTSDSGTAIVSDYSISDSGDQSLLEGDTLSGQSAILLAPNGLQTLVVNGEEISLETLESLPSEGLSLTTELDGVLTLKSFDADSGRLIYSYSASAQQHDGETAVIDNIELSLIDKADNVASHTISFSIGDTSPIARDDLVKLFLTPTPETLAANVVSDWGLDDLGIDLPTTVAGAAAGVDSIDSADASSIDVPISGAYGSFTIDSLGSMTYQVDAENPAVANLSDQAILEDSFTYLLEDADGSTSTATVRVQIIGYLVVPDYIPTTVDITPAPTLAMARQSQSQTRDDDIADLFAELNRSEVSELDNADDETDEKTDGEELTEETVEIGTEVLGVSNDAMIVGAEQTNTIVINVETAIENSSEQNDTSNGTVSKDQYVVTRDKLQLVEKDASKYNGLDHTLIVQNRLPVQSITSGLVDLAYTIPTDTFVHTDINAQVNISINMLDGSDLPTWLSYDPDTATLSGQPPAGESGDVVLKVVARDESGRQAETLLKINIDSATLNRARDSLSSKLQSMSAY